jgi:hypothetical protein
LPPDKILMTEGDNQRGVIGHPLATRSSRWSSTRTESCPGHRGDLHDGQRAGHLNGNPSLVLTTDSKGLVRTVLTLGPERATTTTW